MIAFLHTAKIHISRFEKILKQYNYKNEIQHFVNEEILQTALERGKLDIENFQKQILQIQKLQPEIIICTCSSYGTACGEFENVKRIDQPIVEYLVKKFDRIVVAFTALSTKAVTLGFIDETIYLQKNKVEIVECDCTHCWKDFEAKDFDKYELGIAEEIKKNQQNGAAIFLAQASMEGAKKYLSDFDQVIFSSPEFGVKYLLSLEK